MPDPLDPALDGLEPQELWRQFDAIRRIPRPSLFEEGVRIYLRGIAETQGWPVRQDAAGNLLLRVPGAGRGRNSAPLALQGHMDMVCEKDPGVEHDFHRDPIQLRRSTKTIDGKPHEVLQAVGTTLGSAWVVRPRWRSRWCPGSITRRSSSCSPPTKSRA
jgi:dipeptidase D